MANYGMKQFTMRRSVGLSFPVSIFRRPSSLKTDHAIFANREWLKDSTLQILKSVVLSRRATVSQVRQRRGLHRCPGGELKIELVDIK
jgi:hypothetical protein